MRRPLIASRKMPLRVPFLMGSKTIELEGNEEERRVSMKEI
jgi:hypothetical protein